MSNYNDINNPNYNSNINQNQDNNFMSNMTNENFINMASSIDLDNLNGTSIMDLGQNTISTLNNLNNLPSLRTMETFNNNIQPPINNMQTFNNLPPINPLNNTQNNNVIGQDKNLIKSITRELINNLKGNNISLHDDNTTYNSNFTKRSNNKKIEKKIDNFDYSNDNYDDDNYDNLNYDENNSNQSHPIIKNKKIKKIYEYKDDLKKGFEHMMTENGVPASSNVSSYIFDDLFNLKEFIILFGVYFLLSQEMVKDLFAQYFTSLNPDDSGRVHVKGVIIYGLILTILFMVLKKLI
jgi:hypothetical protein